MHASLSPVSLDTGLLLLSIVGYITMATACPSLCQCNLDYFVYCRNRDLDSDQLVEIMAEIRNDVQLLDLGFNKITTLPMSIFSNLPNLQILNLESNQLNKLPSEAFFNLPNLEELSLNKNVINQLTYQPWSKIPSLTKLDLSENYIDFIDSSSFSALSNLMTLNLRQNQIGVLNELTFSGLSSLTSLDVSHNIIQRIANDSFQDLGRMTTLDLSNNMLTNVHEGIFTGLRRLRELFLDFNKLSSLDHITNSDFAQGIVKMSIVDNEITHLSGAMFSKFWNLRELYLDRNKISSIESGAFFRVDLNKLSVSHNRLVSLKREMFNQVHRIRWLDFSHNRITSLSTGVFDSFRETVLVIRLEGNDLTYIDSGHFRGMKHLHCLNLTNNKITTIKNDSFVSLTDLQDLVLSDNKLSRMTPRMLEGVHLERLYLICNPLRQFSGFKYGLGVEGNPRNVHMNLTVVSQAERSVKVTWPYCQGSQIYWTVQVRCLDSDFCDGSYREDYLPPFKTEHVVKELSPLTDYYICVNPVFVNRAVKIEQCINVRTREKRTTDSYTGTTEPLTSAGHSAGGSTCLGALVILLVLRVGEILNCRS